MIIKIIILILFICICLTLFFIKKKEPFWFIPPNTKLCKSCANKSRFECRRCSECGVCTMPSGESYCVEGNQEGPYNGQDCVAYEYGNDYANLSLIDPKQPYWLEPNRYWNWNMPIYANKNKPVKPSETFPLYSLHSYTSHNRRL
jgi:hypothetical protein